MTSRVRKPFPTSTEFRVEPRAVDSGEEHLGIHRRTRCKCHTGGQAARLKRDSGALSRVVAFLLQPQAMWPPLTTNHMGKLDRFGAQA